MPSALRPLRVTQIVMLLLVFGRYAFLRLPTKIGKSMNNK